MPGPARFFALASWRGLLALLALAISAVGARAAAFSELDPNEEPDDLAVVRSVDAHAAQAAPIASNQADPVHPAICTARGAAISHGVLPAAPSTPRIAGRVPPAPSLLLGAARGARAP